MNAFETGYACAYNILFPKWDLDLVTKKGVCKIYLAHPFL
jgi:hypothetical protein